ncbi:MAG: hypothetical protein LBT79_08055, partial [Elusimicrobiota bacterium]|nr:hypothetical protein [Elusimicrobiota bacterium]
GIQTFIKFPFVIEKANNLLLMDKPYFSEDGFICPYIVEEMTDEQKTSFMNFLYDQWANHKKKTEIKNIDWTKIDEKETVKVLGFNPKISVYPSEYACKNEQLPEYLIEWVNNEEQKIQFLSDLGIWTEDSVIVALRKFLKGDIEQFANNQLAQEKRSNDNKTMLFNTFEWLKANKIELKTKEQYETFKKVVEIINNNRKENQALIIQDEYDFEELLENSEEWDEDYYHEWKNEVEDKFSVFLYDNALPKTIGLDKIDDYVFYRYNGGDAVLNEDVIYLNKNADIKKALSTIASDENNDFTFEDLWKLFDTRGNATVGLDDTQQEKLKFDKQISKQKELLEKEKASLLRQKRQLETDYNRKINLETKKILHAEKEKHKELESKLKLEAEAKKKLESDFNKKINLKTKEILYVEKAKQKKMEAELKLQAEAKVKKETAKIQRENKNEKNRFNRLQESFSSLQKNSEKKIDSLKEQLEKKQTPQALGLLEEKIFLHELEKKFPYDKFDHTGKGGDIIHYIEVEKKQVGIICYELKKVSKFDNAHIEQAYKAKQQRKADYGLLVTNAKRNKDDVGFSLYKEVIIIHPSAALALVSLLRENLILIAKMKLNGGKREESINAVLEYIQSPVFKNGIEDIINTSRDLYKELKKEVDSHIKIWKGRHDKYINICKEAINIKATVSNPLNRIDKSHNKIEEMNAILLPEKID